MFNDKKWYTLIGIQVLLFVLAIVGMAIVIGLGNRFISNADNLVELLQGYENWYRAVWFVCIGLGIFFTLVNIPIVLASFKVSAKFAFGSIIFALMPLAVLATVAISDDMLGYANLAAAEIVAIDQDDFLVIEVEQFGQSFNARLPEPLGGNLENNLRRVITTDVNGERIEIHLLLEEYDELRTLISTIRTEQ